MKVDVTNTVGDTKIHHIQYSELDKKKKRLISYDHFSLQKNSSKPEVLKNKFGLRIYTAKQLRDMLKKNGFVVLGQYAMNGSNFRKRKQGKF